MVTLAQRLEGLREERGMSRPALSAALGLPKSAVEKFETGRQTPTKEQQEKIASYFGVSLFYLRGESSDRTRQEDWMDAAAFTDEVPVFVPKPAPKPPKSKAAEPAQGGMLDAMLASKGVQELLWGMVLDVLRSPEGQAVIAQAVRRELKK